MEKVKINLKNDEPVRELKRTNLCVWEYRGFLSWDAWSCAQSCRGETREGHRDEMHEGEKQQEVFLKNLKDT